MNRNKPLTTSACRQAPRLFWRGMRACALLGLVMLAMVWGRDRDVRAEEPAFSAVHMPEQKPAWLEPYRLRYTLYVPGDRTQSKAQSIIAQLPTGGWLQPQASDVTVQTSGGETLPISVLSHDPKGETLIQFPRHGDDAWYWVSAVAPGATPPTAKPAPEGLTVEVRRWEGEDISSWAAVRQGLEESTNVVGNAVVAEIVQNCNPAEPNNLRQFAASYRGYLNVEKPGVYRFFVNAEDSSFLFIDGYKVIESVGVPRRLTGNIPLRSIGVDIELAAGKHPLEVHHVIGNNPTAVGYCALMWVPPGEKQWAFVPPTAFEPADVAVVADLESSGNKPAAIFAYGNDDSLRSGDGDVVYLVRFEANGPIADEKALVWDFGDGTTGQGRSQTHVYFASGDYEVRLKSGDLPPFHRNVHVWPVVVATSPLSLPRAMQSLASSDWKKFDQARLMEMFRFLMVCEQPDRWRLVEAVSKHLLEQKGFDPKLRELLCTAQMDAMAQDGRGAQAVELGQSMLPEFAKIPSLKAGIELAIAQIYQRHLDKLDEASKLYESIVTEHRRVEHPNVRIAAIRWGDLFAEAGDLPRAAECYRLAEDLGGEAFRNSSLTGAVTRGALLRTAEQKLRDGNVQQTQALLDRIELNYPQQKLEGLYRLLRADADRQSGRYEDALRNYDILLKLKQWAGFYDRALYGVADTYYRLGDYPQALEWLGKLQRAYPQYYEAESLADYQRKILERQDKTKDAQPDAKFSGYAFNFDPQAVDAQSLVKQISLVPRLGFVGSHTGLCMADIRDPEIKKDLVVPQFQEVLTNLTDVPYFWCEIWYRDTGMTPLVLPVTRFDFGFASGGLSFYPERTFGQWRKAAFLSSASKTPTATMATGLHFMNGIMELDAVRVEVVSDREVDALNNFQKGSEVE